jgi:hypothetical protein
MLFAMVCVEETPFETKRVLFDASARSYLQATAASSSGVAQAATAGEPSQPAEVFVFLVGIVDETGRNFMGLVQLL